MHHLQHSTRVLRAQIHFIAVSLFVLTGCSGNSTTADSSVGAFTIVDSTPSNGSTIRLNVPVRIAFSRKVDALTAQENAFAFEVRDLQDRIVDEPVNGTFRIGRNVEGALDARVLEFVPRFPTKDSFDDGGFRPSRKYAVRLTHDENGRSRLRDEDGRPLTAVSDWSLSFRTTTGTTPSELFENRKAGGPRVVGISVTPEIDGRVALNDHGGAPVEIVIWFDQALNASSENLDLRSSLDASRAMDRGRVSLEYDDPELGPHQHIRSTLELASQRILGSTLVLRPEGILPNQAQIRIIVEPRLEDISGESNATTPGYQRVVGTFLTEDRFATQFDAVTFSFEHGDPTDYTAPLREPLAEVVDGELRANMDLPGTLNEVDYEPRATLTILSTDLTTIVPRQGPEITVRGGVFDVRSLTVPAGVTLQGVGSNPMVWNVAGDVRIDGHLNVDGGNGAHEMSFGRGNPTPNSGGRGACTGGNGGRGGTSMLDPLAVRGENGKGPFQEPDGGGQGGSRDCATGIDRAAGGGGGSHVEVGDADFVSTYDRDTAANGFGGDGLTAGVVGGRPMPPIVRDARDDNDFWGRQVDRDGRVVPGELLALRGGGGGGGGGDRIPSTTCHSSTLLPALGGGGGGGAGVLVIRALGTITIGPRGLVSANGGNGGGGADVGGCRQGGGGGGGAGGMVVLEATRIVIHEHGHRWADKDTVFAIAADGGVGSNTSWGSTAREKKSQVADGSINRGGFGGMGVIQLMTPPGRDLDGTGNVQDDSIIFLDKNGNEQANKLDWLVDGDLRPNPACMPATFGWRSAWSSRYLATGASVRRIVESIATRTRSTTQAPPYRLPHDYHYGPDYNFAGVEVTGMHAGYVTIDTATGKIDAPLEIVDGRSRFAIEHIETTEHRGLGAHRVVLDRAVLPADGSWAQHQAVVISPNEGASEYRILAHDTESLLLDARDGMIPESATHVSVLAKFFEITHDGVLGLGPVRPWQQPYRKPELHPISNVQLGFAFHSDPTIQASPHGVDPLRYPHGVEDYVHDLEASTPSSTRTIVRRGHYAFAKLFVRFDRDYNPRQPGVPSANPPEFRSNRPALRWLRLPFAW